MSSAGAASGNPAKDAQSPAHSMTVIDHCVQHPEDAVRCHGLQHLLVEL